jgi:hypothetical protein
LHGLQFIPFLAIGGVVSTWQLICRYKAIRATHQLSWKWAFWATVLPLVVYLVVWIIVGLVGVAAVAMLVRR